MALQRAVYQTRDAEHIVLHQVIAEHLEVFLRAVAEAGDGAGLPQFVEREFREFLTCGVFEHGVARFRCEGCARAPGAVRARTLRAGAVSAALSLARLDVHHGPLGPQRLHGLEAAVGEVVAVELDAVAVGIVEVDAAGDVVLDG